MCAHFASPLSVNMRAVVGVCVHCTVPRSMWWSELQQINQWLGALNEAQRRSKMISSALSSLLISIGMEKIIDWNWNPISITDHLSEMRHFVQMTAHHIYLQYSYFKWLDECNRSVLRIIQSTREISSFAFGWNENETLPIQMTHIHSEFNLPKPNWASCTGTAHSCCLVFT